MGFMMGVALLIEPDHLDGLQKYNKDDDVMDRRWEIKCSYSFRAFFQYGAQSPAWVRRPLPCQLAFRP